MASTFSFEKSVEYLQDIGVFEFVLPFLLIFSIVFAALEKTKILGDDKTNINAVVSLVIGLILIVQQSIVEIINIFLPRVSLILVVVLMGLLLISVLAGSEFKGLQKSMLGLGMVAVVIAVIIALSAPIGGFAPSWLSSREIESLLRIAIPVGVLLFAIWFIMGQFKGESDPPTGSSIKNLLEGIAGGIKE